MAQNGNMGAKNFYKFSLLKMVVKTSLVVVLLTGLLNLAEGMAGFSIFRNLFSEFTPMRPVTAILLVMLSVSLWSLLSESRWNGLLMRITGFITIIVSFFSLLSYKLWNEPFQQDVTVVNFFLHPDYRMALLTALIFLFLGIIHILFSYKSQTHDDFAHIVIFPAAILSYFVLISYVMQIPDAFRIQGIYTAPTTALCLFLLSFVVLFLKPRTWLMKILSGPESGSLMGRRLIPWLLILPAVVSWLRIKADQHNYFSDEVGVVVVAVAYTLSFILLIWWTALNLNKIDKKRQKAYNTLRESESRLNALIAAISDVVYRMSPDWKRMYSMKGGMFLKSVEEPVDDWMNNFIPADAQPIVLDTIQKAVETKCKFELEHKVIGKDGSTGWTYSRAIPVLLDNGDIKEWIGIAVDITQRVESEERLKQSQELLRIKERDEAMRMGAETAMLRLNEELIRSNKELEQFAYLTSHDLQEPLRTITTYADLLLQKLKGNIDNDTEKIINAIVQSSLRLKNLISDLLTYSIIGSSTTPFTEVDFNHVFSKVVNNLRHIIKEKNAHITRSDLPVVSGDENQLFQLLKNLVDNSLKFSAKEPLIHVSASEETDHFLFSVSDNGIGFDDKYGNKIFLIFQRLVNRREYAGTGIGLAICKRIVERHGGRIFFKSELNTGSIFYFTIPKVNSYEKS